MKNNKILILLILLLQGICCVGFAQNPCEPKEPQPLPPKPQPQPTPKPVDSTDVPVLNPVDPNEIIGLEGYNAPESTDTMRWVSATQSLTYTIYFENDAELAMAAASKVTITVPLHEKLNYATFGVGSFGFGNHIFTVEGSPSSYQTRIDLRDSMGIYLDVVAGLDIVHNEAFWIFQSIDPATGLPPTDIHLGFLPINDSLHSGEGFVTCTIKPKAGECVTGDTVSATASIVFDVNEAIPTNTWVNTIDAFAPTSTLTITPNAAGDMLTATFEGEDDEGGCGIKQYKLYYSVNGSSYQLYDVYPVGDTAQIPVETGMEYEFFTLAEDNVGNCEPMKTQPEYNIGTNFVTLAVNAFPQEAGTVTGSGTYSMNDTAQLTATVAEGYHFVNWMSQGVPVSTENPYSAVVSQNQTYTAYFERNAYTLQTLAAAGSTITVTDLNGNEVPSGSTVLHADKLIVQTTHEQCYNIIGSLANDMAFTSGDTITVIGDMVISTQTLPLFNAGDTIAVVCNNYDWYGFTYTSSGDYTHTLTNASGCDSVVTLHLTVNYSNTGDTTAVACDSFYWYGTTYTSSGDYTHTLTNASGCDSVVTLHLTVNYSNTGDTAAVACDSFDWYGATYTSSGDYTHTHTNASGCDSVVTLHLTVNYSNTGDTTAVVCDSFDWYETTYTSSGDYSYTLTNASGCDSVVTLHLTVNYSNTGDTAAVACDSFDWYGTTYTTSGDYTHTLTNASGCDSVVTLHLTVNYSNTGDTNAIACDSYAWNDSVYTQSGDYVQTFTNVDGCDSVVTLHLTVNNSVTAEYAETACDSYTWNDSVYTQSGDYVQTFTNADGCDSIVTLHLTVNHSVTAEYTETACNSYTWNDSVYTQSGDYVQAFTNAEGCDSIVTLHLTVNHSVTAEYAETACDSYTWNDSVYTQSGDYVQTFTNVDGCDSVVTLHLTVNYSNSGDTTTVVCDSFDWYGATYTASGDYTHTLTNANGCDSVVTLHLTVNPIYNINNYLTICESELPYHYSNGLIDTTFEVGTAELLTLNYYLLTESGCDSIVTFYLTVEPTDSTEFAVTTDSCYIWNGLAYCASGNYTQIIQNAYGCDSVVTLHLTVTVGIDGYNGFDIVLYPNPAKEILNVQCTMGDVCGEDATVELLDVYGKLLQTVRMSPETTTLNVGGLAGGVYFVRVTTDRGMVTKPFVKK